MSPTSAWIPPQGTESYTYPQFAARAHHSRMELVTLPERIYDLPDAFVEAVRPFAVGDDTPDAIFGVEAPAHVWQALLEQYPDLWRASAAGEPHHTVFLQATRQCPSLTLYAGAQYKPGFGWGLQFHDVVASDTTDPRTLGILDDLLTGAVDDGDPSFWYWDGTTPSTSSAWWVADPLWLAAPTGQILEHLVAVLTEQTGQQDGAMEAAKTLYAANAAGAWALIVSRLERLDDHPELPEIPTGRESALRAVRASRMSRP